MKYGQSRTVLGSPDGRGFRERVRAAAPAGTLRFGYITDAHCEEGPDPAGYGASSLAQLAHFSREARACGAEFLVCGGDLCSRLCCAWAAMNICGVPIICC